MTVKTNISDLGGVGPTFAAQLAKAGVETTQSMLSKGKTREGRTQIATKSGCSEAQVLRWVHLSDLVRVDGVGTQFADLLEASGVGTVKELGTRVPASLLESMTKLNAEKSLVGSLPADTQVSAWIESAKTLSPSVEF